MFAVHVSVNMYVNINVCAMYVSVNVCVNVSVLCV